VSSIDLDRLILIVTGAHLHAEATDRPIAYSLANAISEQQRGERGRVLVCSDLWYLNNEPLRSCPTISIGGPAVNALSAYLADKLPSAFVVEGKVLVQADPGFDEAVACCWGADEAGTAAAVNAFIDRYLAAFLEAATTGWE
jgi:hypothetical protein